MATAATPPQSVHCDRAGLPLGSTGLPTAANEEIPWVTAACRECRAWATPLAGHRATV